LTWNPTGELEITADASSSFPWDVIMVDESGGMRSVTVDNVNSRVRYDPPDTSSLFMRVPGGNWLVRARDASSP
jgi:hypothetical protein